jgi:hypothetical protein
LDNPVNRPIDVWHLQRAQPWQFGAVNERGENQLHNENERLYISLSREMEKFQFSPELVQHTTNNAMKL